ncbi:MAG: hypothetical protein GY721_00715, partial [Deltaproteobacteria bacterium]|nr:hypothetical protein [Deltaproteobacteria bacterium]
LNEHSSESEPFVEEEEEDSTGPLADTELREQEDVDDTTTIEPRE